MSSVDLSANVLWQTLSKDVCSLSRQEKSSSTREIIQEESAESRPLVPKEAKCIKKQGSNWLSTSFLIVNTALGIGILNFPAAYNQAGGVLYATFIQVVMVLMMLSTMLILAYCSDFNGDNTYHNVLLSMCGRRGQQLAALTITLTLYCVCVAFLIIIGDQMDSLLHSLYGPGFCERWFLNRHFTISAISIVLILPTCFCKRVDFLAFIGSVGIFAMLYPVFLTVYGYFKLNVKHVEIKTKPDDLSGMFAMFPVLGLGYQCQEVVVPVYSCMRERRLGNFVKSSIVAMIFLFIVYSIIGCFGYLTFGANVTHNVMKMYNADDPFVMVGVFALIIKMVATYPILATCGRDAAAGLYAELRNLKPSEFVSAEKQRRYVAGAIWFSTSLILATTTDGIGIVLKYLGSVASANIFIYPGICLMQVVLMKDPDLKKIKNRLLVAYGIAVAAVGAFCLGVVLFEAILNPSDDDATVDLCHTLPSTGNVTLTPLT